MNVVPVYRLIALSSYRTETPRFRFSRDPNPDPNPLPGDQRTDTDPDWIIDRVAFYAWADQYDGDAPDPDLRPVYEFYRQIPNTEEYQYYYSMDPAEAPAAGDGPEWSPRAYVAFWAYPADDGHEGPAVYRFSRDVPEWGLNHALSVSPQHPGWTRDGTVFHASPTLPVQVSARRDLRDPSRVDWTFEPSTLNLPYAGTIVFRRAPHSDWDFRGFEVVGGDKDFDEPVVRADRVSVGAKYKNKRRDFKYLVRVAFAGDANEIVGDPEVVNQTPDVL